jgi:hypothetical protein
VIRFVVEHDHSVLAFEHVGGLFVSAIRRVAP